MKRKKTIKNSPNPVKRNRVEAATRDDRIKKLKELKAAMASDKISPGEFFGEIDALKNKDLQAEAYRTVSSDTETGRELLKKMNDRQLETWADSLGLAGRALESESLSQLLGGTRPKRKTIKDSTDSKGTLQDVALILQRVIGDKDQGPKGGGVGSPGFTKENTESAEKIEAKDAHQYIANKILGADGETVRADIRKDPSDANKEKAGKMIRKINYSDALSTEMHAIGLGNDVLAASWVKGIRYASPYQQIAREIDEITNNYFSTEPGNVAKIIAQYAGVSRTDSVRYLAKEENQKFGAKLREFATIQIAEKGREVKRAAEAVAEDKKLVEKALRKAETEGFSKVYVTNTRDNAPFAAEGGQQKLREIYGAVAAKR